MALQDLNLGGGGSPSSPSDIYGLIESFWANQSYNAEAIGKNIHQAVAETEMKNQGKQIAAGLQKIDTSNPQQAIQQMAGLAAKNPMGAQLPGIQSAISMLGSQAQYNQQNAPIPGLDGATPDGSPQLSGNTTATSYATPADKALSERTGGKEGDNGVGAWDNPTGRGSGPQVSFPLKTMETIFGKNWKQTAKDTPVTVWTDDGRRVQARIGDVGPGASTGAGMDMNPDVTDGLGIKDPDNFKGKVNYSIGGQANQSAQPQFALGRSAQQAAPGEAPVDAFTTEYQQAQSAYQSAAQTLARIPLIPGNPKVMAARKQYQTEMDKQETQIRQITHDRAMEQEQDKRVGIAQQNADTNVAKMDQHGDEFTKKMDQHGDEFTKKMQQKDDEFTIKTTQITDDFTAKLKSADDNAAAKIKDAQAARADRDVLAQANIRKSNLALQARAALKEHLDAQKRLDGLQKEMIKIKAGFFDSKGNPIKDAQKDAQQALSDQNAADIQAAKTAIETAATNVSGLLDQLNSVDPADLTKSGDETKPDAAASKGEMSDAEKKASIDAAKAAFKKNPASKGKMSDAEKKASIDAAKAAFKKNPDNKDAIMKRLAGVGITGVSL